MRVRANESTRMHMFQFLCVHIIIKASACYSLVYVVNYAYQINKWLCAFAENIVCGLVHLQHLRQQNQSKIAVTISTKYTKRWHENCDVIQRTRARQQFLSGCRCHCWRQRRRRHCKWKIFQIFVDYNLYTRFVVCLRILYDFMSSLCAH